MSDPKPVSFNKWFLFILLAIAGILALVDRQVISVLKPEMAAELGWTDDDYGTLGAWFQGSMAVALLVSGPLVDRIGVKWANVLGVFTWSIAAMFHGLAHTMNQFVLCRIGLGVTEAMATPSAVKTVATILPPNQRSVGFGLINAISSVGAISAPILIPFMAIPFGWRGAFVIAGIAGIVWSVVWLVSTRKTNFGDVAVKAPPQVAATPAGPKLSILKDKATWAISGAKLLSDSTWWLLLFWMPDFLHRQYGISGVAIGPPLALAYAGGALGALVSGAAATHFLTRGYPVNRVRKLAMLISGLMVLVLPLASQADSAWGAAAILAVVLAAHQGFSTNLFALIADVTEKTKVGQVTSFAAFCGNIGGMTIVKVAGLVLTAGLGYYPLFVFAGASYLMALAWIHLLLPNIKTVDIGAEAGDVLPTSLH
ncbi:MFS transporter [Phenylobacterium sp.]|jgi:ACS family hexuronate transporter-like MFS transporter|uniref:MFS transporter n=1 Tax=Phenylobacterium sp. TaxID=1871053 RepID=UPI0037C8E0EB